MRFVASLQKNSYIHFSWRGAARIGGMLHNVFFKLRTNGRYVTDPLQDHEIAVLKTHPHVQIEVTADAPVLEARKKAPETAEPASEPEPPADEVAQEEGVPQEPEPELTADEAIPKSEAAPQQPKKRGRPKKR